MKAGCIAAFAKTPKISAVKTRLAEAIGSKKAEEIYIACVNATQETLKEFKALRPDWDVNWALAEKNTYSDNFWKNRPFDKIWTGEGELGTRLHHVYSSLKQEYENVILIGTDSPQLSAFNLIHAVDVTKKNHAVIGPAHDGGYYLFGSSQDIDKGIWESVPYSVPNTCDEFLKLLPDNVEKIDPLTDLDEVKDIEKVLSEMPRVLHDAQEKLIEFLNDYSS